MHSLKKSLFITLFVIVNLTMAQSFDYSGPTTISLPFGQTTATGTYYFTYHDINELFMPKLLIFLDGDLLSPEPMCEGATPFTPLSFNITFTQGDHTVIFRLMSLTGVSNCVDAPLHQEEQFTVH